ncbi:MAG: DUF3300 domain-containing protein [Terracidiphilus sp.]|jgi:hypothetical protein
MRQPTCMTHAAPLQRSTGGASQRLRRLVALVMVPFLLILARGKLHAQQGPGETWPQSSQFDPGGPESSQPPQPTQPLAPEQLQQLVAPIALYPDTLVAQVLAAATYPAQVAGADHWLQSQGYASPDQIAAGADAEAWDPSVKALTAFPQVLAQMDRNLQWTTDLGNAYYNQPQDVLETVQVLRQRAQAAGTLENTPQEAVSYNQGYIQLAPTNPQIVFVPAYNPWAVYGQPVAPYQGFSLFGSLASLAGSSPIRFGLGIAMSTFSHTPFGWATWALNWLTQSVLFHQSNYQSNSTSVAHWGLPPNHRPQPEGNSRQWASNSRPQAGYGRPATEFSRQVFAREPARGSESGSQTRSYAGYRSDEFPSRGYPAQQTYDNRSAPQPYNHFQAAAPMTAREQAEGRTGYGTGFYGNLGQNYASRPATAYANPQQNWNASAPGPERGDFVQRSYSGNRSYSASAGRGFAEPKSAHSGGFHLFGGGHNAERSYAYGGGHSAKSYSSGKSFSKGHSGGGGHSGGHHGSGHHH